MFEGVKKKISVFLAIALVLGGMLGLVGPGGGKAYAAATQIWQEVGSAGFSAGTADYTSLYVDNGTPYVAYSDAGKSYKATVMKHDGSNWVPVGSAGFSVGAADFTSLYVDNGTPYVAYSDAGNSYKATVMKYDGSNWVPVGSAGFSVGAANFTSLYVDNGTPYVAYADWGNSSKATVMKYDGSNWVPVGSAGFSAGATGGTSLYVDNGTPYVAYADEWNSYKATVMKHDGSNWVPVGSAGFSAGTAHYTSLYVDNGTPYVAYSDAWNSYKATVEGIKYLLTYNDNGATSGSAPVDSHSYWEGETASILGNTGSLTKTGNTFAGWTTVSGAVYQPNDPFTIQTDTTFSPKWTINPYTVSYDGNGNTGGTVPAAVTQDYNTNITVADNTGGGLTKPGYTFAGWNTKKDGNGTSYSPNSGFTVPASDTTLYAQWTINPYTVSYDGNGNTGGTVPAAVTQDYNTNITAADNTGGLTKPGYTFAGWNTRKDGSGTAYSPSSSFTVPASDTTLYAQWISKNAFLGGLTVNPGTLTFAPSDTNYIVKVSPSVTSLDVSFTKGDPNQTITVTGAVYQTVTGSVYDYRASNLVVGTNPIQIQVTAQDGTKNSYHLSIERLSNNADLSGLTLFSGTLSPTFVANKTSYDVSVSNSVSSITVTASVYDSKAALTVNGTAVDSGQPSKAINLNVGENTITIVVTAQDGTTKTYTITVTRARASSSSNTSGGGGGGATPATGDKITVEIAPERGGTVTLGKVKMEIPANSFASVIKVTVEKLTASVASSLSVEKKMQLAGDVYEISKDQSGNFDKEITITLPFGKSKIDLDKVELAIYWYNEETGKWEILDNIKVDLGTETISGTVNHFTKFAVLAIEKETEEVEETAPTAPSNVQLTDIAGHWAEENIRRLVGLGAINGYPDGSFKPNHNITRAEFATILVKALGLEEREGKVFTDTANHWAREAIATAEAHGIIKGYDQTTFGANDPITREQMAVMIMRALNLWAEMNGGVTFTDETSISSWAQEAVMALQAQGIIGGYLDGSFQPQREATRAEAVVILVRSLDYQE